MTIEHFPEFVEKHSSNKTDEFSFMLKKCEYGVGVFAVHDIDKGVVLRICGEDKPDISRLVKKQEVAEPFLKYCLDQGDGTVIRPRDFGCLELVWLLNHSDNPNAFHKDYVYYSGQDIKAGEEILIDYNSL